MNLFLIYLLFLTIVLNIRGITSLLIAKYIDKMSFSDIKKAQWKNLYLRWLCYPIPSFIIWLSTR